MNNKKLLIVQFRDGYLETNEQNAFAHRLQVDKNDIYFLNARKSNPIFPSLDGLSTIILAGSGDVSMLNNNSWFPRLESFLNEAILREDILILGICLGHEILAHILGGKIDTVEKFKELGTVSITLTKEAQNDPIFKSVDSTFYSIAGHNDSVTSLPENCTLLATNNTCPIQAFKVNGRPIYGIQFHPELDQNDFRARLEYYKEHYTKSGADFKAALARGKRETTDQMILQNFVSHITQRSTLQFGGAQNSPVSISQNF